MGREGLAYGADMPTRRRGLCRPPTGEDGHVEKEKDEEHPPAAN